MTALTEICPNEGKDWIAQHALSGASLFLTLLKGATVAGGDISATSTLAALTTASKLATGTGLARIAATLGSSVNGVMSTPTKTFSNGAATDWPLVTSYGLASASSGGVLIYVWDIPDGADMTIAGSSLVIPVQDIFLFNPGES